MNLINTGNGFVYFYGGENDLVSIAVTPANANVVQNTGGHQYTAEGTYGNGNTENITSAVAWDTTNHALATITSGSAGGVLAAPASGGGACNVTATLNGITGQTGVNVTAS